MEKWNDYFLKINSLVYFSYACGGLCWIRTSDPSNVNLVLLRKTRVNCVRSKEKSLNCGGSYWARTNDLTNVNRTL